MIGGPLVSPALLLNVPAWGVLLGGFISGLQLRWSLRMAKKHAITMVTSYSWKTIYIYIQYPFFNLWETKNMPSCFFSVDKFDMANKATFKLGFNLCGPKVTQVRRPPVLIDF